jgi:hypothetical protein
MVIWFSTKARLSALIVEFLGLLLLGSVAVAEQLPIGMAKPTAIGDFQPQGLSYAGVYQLKQIDPNLTGAGIKFAIVSRSITYIDGEPQNDYRPASDHNCFKDTQYIFHDQQLQPAGISPHSTAVCSILLGRDPNAYNEQIGDFHYEGVAPDAQADVYEFWNFLVNNVFPCSAPDANVITADIGYQFEDWWTRGIEAMAQKYGLTVVVGIGNGSNASDPVLFPGAGGNVIGVGVVKSVESNDVNTGLSRFALVYPEYSSIGPTPDGRCKPDIVAPGNCLAAIAGEPNLYEPTGTWSSFATPIVAGTAGLLIQQASLDPNLQQVTARDGGNCVVKSILLNSATKLPYWHKGLLTKDDDHDVPLDYLQGAGMVNAVAASNQLLAGQHLPGDCPTAGWDLNKLNLDQTPENTYKIRITEPAEKMITATITWNKQFSLVYPFEHDTQKDADLRLEIWAVDSNDPNNNYLLDYSDSRTDNVEHVYTPADGNFTDYEIVVLFSNEHDVNQPQVSPPYAVAWNVGQVPVRDDALWFDLNGDGVVDDLDVDVLLDNLIASMETSDRYLFGDINSDGVIDISDLDILMRYIDSAADRR